MKKWMMLAAVLVVALSVSAEGTFATSASGGLFQWLDEAFGAFSEPVAAELNTDHVYQVRSGNQLVAETQNALIPASYAAFDWEPTVQAVFDQNAYMLWDDSLITNTTDKFISVHNGGEKAVFFRTAFGFEYHEDMWSKLHLNLNSDPRIQWTEPVTITAENGKEYKLYVATWLEALEPGETSPALLLQMALEKDVKQLEDHFEIRVKTMAIQTEGFEQTVNGQTVPMSALEALNEALPLPADMTQFQPF